MPLSFAECTNWRSFDALVRHAVSNFVPAQILMP